MYVEAIKVFGPLLAFMMLGVWIPLIAIVGGWVADRVLPQKVSPAAARIEEIKRRSQLTRLGRETA